MRGTKLDGLITGWDWYSTFVHGIAGLDPTDHEAAAAGLPPLDSIDQWPYLTGQTTIPPRTELPLGTTADPTDLWATEADITVHGFIVDDRPRGLWKLLLGRAPQSIWTGPEYPNATTATQPPAEQVYGDCGFETGCLFDLESDPAEHKDLAATQPAVVARLRAKLVVANATVYNPVRPYNTKACEVALARRHDPKHNFGWWGPFAD